MSDVNPPIADFNSIVDSELCDEFSAVEALIVQDVILSSHRYEVAGIGFDSLPKAVGASVVHWVKHTVLDVNHDSDGHY